MHNIHLEIDRKNHAVTRLVEEPLAELPPGQVRFRIDRYAVTANTITYAVTGDALGYWNFFPTAPGWGRVPAMGWAEVVASAHPEVAPGRRYYGWFPMSRYVDMTVTPTADGLRDDGPHRAAHAPVFRAYVGLLQAQANLTKNESEFCRVESLFAKGLVSESEFVQARAGFESAKASLAQTSASMRQANENLRKTRVVSPMDGTISQLNSELGERVLGTAQFQGTDVMTVADLSRMEARVDVGENDIVLISLGDTVRIEVDAITVRKLTGIVYEIGNTAMTRGQGTQEEVTNFQVKIRIVDKEPRLRPGMSMNATIETETKQNVLTVPIQSVTIRMPEGMMMNGQRPAGEGGDEGGEMQAANDKAKKKAEKPKEVVFVLENNAVKTVEIKRGISDDSYTEIVSGVKKDQAVVAGSYKAINRELKDGSKVRVENEPKKDKPANP